jgi:hypothetical protein
MISIMFIVRGTKDLPPPKSVDIKVTRTTPAIVRHGGGKSDHFCVGTPEDVAALRDGGWEIVELRDGWYEDDSGGGVAIFGHGKYWEVRDTPFTVKESVAPGGETSPDNSPGEPVNVRGAIFGV